MDEFPGLTLSSDDYSLGRRSAPIRKTTY